MFGWHLVCLDGALDGTLHALIVPCMLGCRASCLDNARTLGGRLMSGWHRACLDDALQARMLPLMLGYRHAYLDALVDALIRLFTLRFSYPRFEPPSRLSVRGRVHVRSWMRRHTPKCLKIAMRHPLDYAGKKQILLRGPSRRPAAVGASERTAPLPTRPRRT